MSASNQEAHSDYALLSAKGGDGSAGVCIVTISFLGEYLNLFLQARSIKKFSAGLIARWVVVWNEPMQKQEAHRPYLEKIYREFEGSAIQFVIHWRAEIIDFPDPPGSGHGMQQILKLLVAKKIFEPAYILLDTKNHAIRKLVSEDFFLDGKLRTHPQNYRPGDLFHQPFENARALFGVETFKIGFAALPSTTPYPMVTEAVLEMLQYLEQSDDAEWYRRILVRQSASADLTEFALYNAFLESRNFIEKFYTINEIRISTALFAISPKDEMGCLEVIQRAANDCSIKFFGIHKARFEKLGRREKEGISSLWARVGLFSNEAEAVALLENREV